VWSAHRAQKSADDPDTVDGAATVTLRIPHNRAVNPFGLTTNLPGFAYMLARMPESAVFYTMSIIGADAPIESQVRLRSSRRLGRC
jgi:hypothetical protein